MSQTKIEKLTLEQSAKMAECRDKWIEIGLSTAPADRPRAEAAINAAYKAAGLAAPGKIVWCGSPLSQGLTRAIILDKKMIKNVRDSVGDSVWDSVWASVRASVGDSVWDSVGASVWDSVRASVGDSVRASVGASVWDSVGDSVRDSVWDSVWDSVGASGYGQHDASWIAFYEFFRDVCGLENQTEKLGGLNELAKSAGWFIPHANICWVSERHNVLMRDERGRLHCLGGPAVAYPDGWKIYAVHGVRVPEFVVEKPDSITVKIIEDERNAEVRRIMIDQYGQSEYLTDSGAREISRDTRGILYRKDIEGDEPLVMVKVINSTAEPTGEFKDYYLRVPPDITEASQGVAWTFGCDVSQYDPAVET